MNILPDNGTALKIAVDEAGAARTGIPFALRDIHNPDTVPEALLPWLAWQLSVDVWDDDWPVEKKRHVVSIAYDLHRHKGTLWALESHVRLSGGTLVRALVPPDKTHAMPALTDAERDRFLARFKQLRIYGFAERSQQQFKTFTTAANQRGKHFIGEGKPYDAATYTRYARRAKLYEPRDGSLTDLTLRTVKFTEFSGQATDYEEIVLPPKPTNGIYAGQPPKAKLFLSLSDHVAERIVSVAIPREWNYRIGQSQYRTVSTGLTPTYVEPEGVAEKGTRTKTQMFTGDVLNKRFLPPSTAWQRIYERFFLFEKDRLPAARPRAMHVGYTRLGMPAFHAELKVAVRNKRPGRAVNGYVHGFIYHTPRESLNRVIDATRAGKALRDKIWLNTKTVRQVEAGDILAGEIVAGGLVPNL
ncbi:MAG: phage tail protein I [Roseibium sp.]|nr:phage tail protein I [Roseibium sp.]